jgi:plasmid stabilization system protein ParE
MPVDLVIAPEAESDIAETYDWYEGRRPGLGEEFSEQSEATVTIYAVFHTSRDPAKWRRRLP